MKSNKPGVSLNLLPFYNWCVMASGKVIRYTDCRASGPFYAMDTKGPTRAFFIEMNCNVR
jgi:hypothetical protein